jgi:serine/threonine protein kinase
MGYEEMLAQDKSLCALTNEFATSIKDLGNAVNIDAAILAMKCAGVSSPFLDFTVYKENDKKPQTLQAFCEENKSRLTDQLRMDFALQLLLGLKALHEKGFAHLSLNPTNVLARQQSNGTYILQIIGLEQAVKYEPKPDKSGWIVTPDSDANKVCYAANYLSCMYGANELMDNTNPGKEVTLSTVLKKNPKLNFEKCDCFSVGEILKISIFDIIIAPEEACQTTMKRVMDDLTNADPAQRLSIDAAIEKICSKKRVPQCYIDDANRQLQHCGDKKVTSTNPTSIQLSWDASIRQVIDQVYNLQCKVLAMGSNKSWVDEVEPLITRCRQKITEAKTVCNEKNSSAVVTQLSELETTISKLTTYNKNLIKRISTTANDCNQTLNRVLAPSMFWQKQAYYGKAEPIGVTRIKSVTDLHLRGAEARKLPEKHAISRIRSTATQELYGACREIDTNDEKRIESAKRKLDAIEKQINAEKLELIEILKCFKDITDEKNDPKWLTKNGDAPTGVQNIRQALGCIRVDAAYLNYDQCISLLKQIQNIIQKRGLISIGRRSLTKQLYSIGLAMKIKGGANFSDTLIRLHALTTDKNNTTCASNRMSR